MPPTSPEIIGRWGIMGGIFDPIHHGHLILAGRALENFRLDGVLFVVSFSPPHRREKPIASFEDRLRMTGIALESNSNFLISDIEKESGEPAYTLKVVEALKKRHRDVKFYLILGSDNLGIFDSWYKPDELIKQVDIIVGGRPGSEELIKSSGWIDKIQSFNMPLLDISSTQIRRRLKEGKSIKYLLPEDVYAYIKQQGLYR